MMPVSDTIFAQATAAGRAGVSIVRISGSRAAEVFQRFECAIPKARYATLCAFKNGGQMVDQGLALWFPAPHSFTGEDVVELHLHGGRAIMQEMLALLSGMEGFRLAEPGEFSRRAFERGKMDLVQAEGLADLIDAETALQKRQALRIMEGELSHLYTDWREQLVRLLAHLEAYIDFPDEDLPTELADLFQQQAQALLVNITAHMQDDSGRRVREGVYIAIVGAPNAGKSSLLNKLAKRDVAIVSAEAGTTRDAIEVHLDINGYPVTFCDTAGLREQAGEIESEGIRRSLQRAANADIVLCVFDGGSEFDEATLKLIDNRSICIINKCDMDYIPRQLIEQTIYISALCGEGIGDLLDAIKQKLSNIPGNAATYTRERHKIALDKCAGELREFLSSSCAIELRAEHIRRAAHALGSITGKVSIDEVLSQIFSSFCLGK